MPAENRPSSAEDFKPFQKHPGIPHQSRHHRSVRKQLLSQGIESNYRSKAFSPPDGGLDKNHGLESGRRIIVVAPADEGEAIASVLRSFGHTPVPVASLAQGLALLTLSLPHLLVIDVSLLGESGATVVGWNLLAMHGLPVVFIIPGGLPPLEAKEIATIGNGLILRPWHQEQLGAVVEMTLAGARWSHTPNRSLFNAIPDALLLIDPKDDSVLDANAAAGALFGLDCTELLSRKTAQLLKTAAVIRNRNEEYRSITVLKRAGDRTRGVPVEIVQRLLVLNGRQVALIFIRDIRKQSHGQDESDLFSLALEQSPSAVAITDTSGRIQYANRRFSVLTGYSSDEVVGNDISMLHSGFHQAGFFDSMRTTLTQTGRWQGEICNKRNNGELYWEYTSIAAATDASGAISQYIFMMEDITQRKHDEDRLRFQAMYDALTELPNRRLFMERMQQAYLRCQRFKSFMVVLYLDLDGFKAINDTYGHHFGDRLLQEVGKRLQCCLRANDTVARIGGDEFALLLQDLHTPACARTIVAKIRQSLAVPCHLTDQAVAIRASLGMSCYPGDGDGIDALIKIADDRMYLSKQSTVRATAARTSACDFSE